MFFACTYAELGSELTLPENRYDEQGLVSGENRYDEQGLVSGENRYDEQGLESDIALKSALHDKPPW